MNLKFNPTTLKLPCEPVDLLDLADHEGLAKAMGALVLQMDGLGLAANQVGFNIQLIVITQGQDPGKFLAIYNPVIERAWGGKATMNEGCLSAPGKLVRLTRWKRVRVSGLNQAGHPFMWKASGMAARVLQHEIDHMAGVTIFDRARLGIYGRATKGKEPC